MNLKTYSDLLELVRCLSAESKSMYINRIENTTLEYSRNMFGKWPNSKQSKVIMHFLCVITNQAFFGASSTVKQSGIFKMNCFQQAFNSRVILPIWGNVLQRLFQVQNLALLSGNVQKRAKSLIFYSEQFFGHHFSAKPDSYIFWDKWNVEADSESLLKNLKLLPYSILMPDHSIKLYFTGSKDIQIWEYLRAHICSQKILLTPN